MDEMSSKNNIEPVKVVEIKMRSVVVWFRASIRPEEIYVAEVDGVRGDSWVAFKRLDSGGIRDFGAERSAEEYLADSAHYGREYSKLSIGYRYNWIQFGDTMVNKKTGKQVVVTNPSVMGGKAGFVVSGVFYAEEEFEHADTFIR